MTVREFPIVKVFLFFAAVAGIPCGAVGAPQTVEEIANYRGVDRQAILEAGARKEGEVRGPRLRFADGRNGRTGFHRVLEKVSVHPSQQVRR